MTQLSDTRFIRCPHGRGCFVDFTSEIVQGGITVSIDKIGCRRCSEKLAGGDGAAAEYRRLIVCNYITPAL